MIKISKQNNSLIVEGIDNLFYPNNGDNSYPLNSLIVVTDNSDMATFRSVATNDVLFSGLIQNITINGEVVTKDNIIEKFDTVSNSSTGGGGGGGTVDAYTKEEADNKFASKDELTNVQSVANDADTKVDALTPRVEGVETEIAQKANVSDVPTVQTDNTGTNKNYIYSNFASSKHKYNVISALANGSKSADKYSLLLRTWGPVSAYDNFDINAATTTAAGVMSAADKTKLDSIPETIPSQSEIDGIAANVSALEADMMGKQPTLISGTNIKTINNQSILGEGNLEITGGQVDLTNYYTKTEADGKFATVTEVNNQAADISALETNMTGKQDTLVSGTNIKTINNQSILGEGNIEVSGGAKIYKAAEINSDFDGQLFNCINHLNTGENYSQSISIGDNETIYDNFFNNIKYGDIVLMSRRVVLSQYNTYLCEYRGENGGYYRFVVILNKFDNLSNFTADISIY